MRTGKKRTLFVALATLVLMEVVLQLGYLGLWLWYPRNTADGVDTGDRVVLCIGDSYTYGMGASTREDSYPSQLERLLREQLGPEWKVVNDGWPGRASRETLQRLDENLENYRPELVYCLIGTNDAHVRPEELILPEAAVAAPPDDGFQLRWRTGKLISIFWSMIDSPSSSLGHVAEAATKETSATKAEPAEAVPLAERNFWDNERESDYAGAMEIVRARLEAAPPNSLREAECHMHLVRLHGRSGSEDRVAEELAWLRQRRDAQPNRAFSIFLLKALESVKHDDDALALAGKLVEQFPESAEAWRCHAFQNHQKGNSDVALQAIAKAIELAPEHPAMWTTRRSIYWNSDPVESLLSAVRSYGLSGDLDQAKWMIALRKRVDDDTFERLAAEEVADDTARNALKELWYANDDKAADATELTWKSHVAQIIARTRRTGAEAIIANYPHRNLFQERIAELRKETNVTFLDVRKRFQEQMTKEPNVGLFVGDGHCNDAGYRLMAEIMARDAVSRVQ